MVVLSLPYMWHPLCQLITTMSCKIGPAIDLIVQQRNQGPKREFAWGFNSILFGFATCHHATLYITLTATINCVFTEARPRLLVEACLFTRIRTQSLCPLFTLGHTPYWVASAVLSFSFWFVLVWEQMSKEHCDRFICCWQTKGLGNFCWSECDANADKWFVAWCWDDMCHL